MTGRCKKCNKYHRFRNKKGNKLSNYKCDCGGSLELLGGMHAVSGEHAFDKEQTFNSDYFIGPYYYAEKNKEGKYFILNQDSYWVEITNPIFPERTKKNNDI